MNQICVDRCSIDLTKCDEPKPAQKGGNSAPMRQLLPQSKKSEELLYLSDREAVCIETCTKLYLRTTHSIANSYRSKLTF